MRAARCARYFISRMDIGTTCRPRDAHVTKNEEIKKRRQPHVIWLTRTSQNDVRCVTCANILGHKGVCERMCFPEGGFAQRDTDG